MNFKILGDSLNCEYTMDDGEEEKVCNFVHSEPVCVKYHRVLENGERKICKIILLKYKQYLYVLSTLMYYLYLNHIRYR